MKRAKKIGKLLLPLFPSLSVRLKQAEMEVSADEYLGKSIITSFFFGFFGLIIMLLFNFIVSPGGNFIGFVVFIPVFISAVVFIYNLLGPSMIVSKRVLDIEANLLFSLRHLLVEMRSGINNYDSFVSLSKSDYGAVSVEFSKLVRNISYGVSETQALEELMIKNPSINFRRALWQILNAIRSGSDLSGTIEELVKEYSLEQKTKIKMYGGQLNSLALVYMIFAIIIPSIGITFLIILSFFSNFAINEGLLALILLVIVVFQFVFIGVVKSKRPRIE
ncbi:MAG: type II secretion system F family protein [Candidatus Aenigmarchaeota archaeon]|nr:type II secretion system F family protein [Candidatus Aenigmarchaeota archaeon]